MPFFFDLSSLIPTVERNPFEPLLVRDEIPGEQIESNEEIAAEPIVDTGLPIPSHYDFDMMHTMVQDPFRLYVYWHLKGNPYERVQKIFPPHEAANFRLALRLIDETNNIAVFFDVPFTREYWFSVFPDRRYRVELGLRSPNYGYIKMLSTQPVTTPRGGPSDQVATEPEYYIGADDYLRVLRDSHLIPERAYSLEGLLPGAGAVPAGARNQMWDSLPSTFRHIMTVIGDIQAGREYDKWWEKLGQEELAELVREFLAIIREMGDGEMGYILLMRYLPELLRRAIRAEGGEEVRVDKPVALFLAERLGQTASEMSQVSPEERELGLPEGAQAPGAGAPGPGGISMGPWMPSMTR